MYFSSMFLKLSSSESSLALSHLALFGFIEVTLLVKRTSGKKSHSFWAIFTRFRRVDDH